MRREKVTTSTTSTTQSRIGHVGRDARPVSLGAACTSIKSAPGKRSWRPQPRRSAASLACRSGRTECVHVGWVARSEHSEHSRDPRGGARPETPPPLPIKPRCRLRWFEDCAEGHAPSPSGSTSSRVRFPLFGRAAQTAANAPGRTCTPLGGAPARAPDAAVETAVGAAGFPHLPRLERQRIGTHGVGLVVPRHVVCQRAQGQCAGEAIRRARAADGRRTGGGTVRQAHHAGRSQRVLEP